mgnify:FL=1
MKDELELDPKILVKNLEITKLTQQVDQLRSENVNLKEAMDRLKEMIELKNKNK